MEMDFNGVLEFVAHNPDETNIAWNRVSKQTSKQALPPRHCLILALALASPHRTTYLPHVPKLDFGS